MRMIVLAGAALLTACGGSTESAEKAERQYFLLQEGFASKRELCAAAMRAADAWLALENQAKYQQWATFRDADCAKADVL